MISAIPFWQDGPVGEEPPLQLDLHVRGVPLRYVAFWDQKPPAPPVFTPMAIMYPGGGKQPWSYFWGWNGGAVGIQALSPFDRSTGFVADAGTPDFLYEAVWRAEVKDSSTPPQTRSALFHLQVGRNVWYPENYYEPGVSPYPMLLVIGVPINHIAVWDGIGSPPAVVTREATAYPHGGYGVQRSYMWESLAPTPQITALTPTAQSTRFSANSANPEFVFIEPWRVTVTDEANLTASIKFEIIIGRDIP